MAPVKDAARGGLLVSLAADAHALGGHWIYDTSQIERLEDLAAPPPGSHHKNRGKGDFTHYGDQVFVLLESVADQGGFDLDDFFRRWKLLFSDYDGYIDGATRQTRQRIDFGEGPDGSGANSTDLAGAARIAPLVAAHHDDLDALVEAARAQTRMTHNNPLVVESAEFFARTAHAVLSGDAPVDAMRRAADAEYLSAPIDNWLDKGLDFADTETVAAIAQFGQSCNIEGAFPGVVHLLARHADDPAEGFIQNVLAGGDSAARGLLMGLVLGCAHGENAVPAAWIDGMTKSERIRELADALAGALHP